jgi:predicted ATP-binding protein involved in virulence
MAAFPKARFIVSTHSPLIVGSVRDASVFVLRYTESKKIRSERLDLTNQAKTAAEILDEVLGVSSSMPLWAEDELARIVKRIAAVPLNESSFAELRRELKAVGLEKLLPDAITSTMVQRDKTP